MPSEKSLQKQPINLEELTELLRVEEMPIFSNTAQNIYVALDDKKKGALELGAVILQDPNLTAKLLRVSNTPYYNPSRQKINTVSRAIVILGMAVIRELTLACSFFESILSSTDKERANKEIAHAIHSAVQARELAIMMGDQSPEEVFIAALLHNIGHIAFWCSSNRRTLEIHRQITRSGLQGEAAEKQVLGFSLADLSKKLSKSWHLGGLIEEAINRPEASDTRIQTVCMGNRICDAIAAGWESKVMEDCLQKLQSLSGHAQEDIKTKLKASVGKAVDIARQFGAHDASLFINPDHKQSTADNQEDERPDKKQIQFQVLQDITSHISGTIDLNVLFEMVLEGIHRGVEMDRTLFMLMSPDKKALNEKIFLGFQKRDVEEKMRVYNNEMTPNLFFYVLAEQEGLWVKPKQHAALFSPQIDNHFGRHECFVFPIQVQQKPIGLIYCDRSIRNEALTLEDFSVAKHFVKQAEIGLTLYRMKNN